jgi:uncharacterized protein
VQFEFDPRKSRANKAKHGIDFEEAQAFWDDENALVVEFAFPGESRLGRIARIVRFGSQTWTVIYTMRGASVRIISARRAKKKEIQAYESEREGENG